ncbi:hypothetical protein FOZ61_010284 [Perkinsus olseni]|uniref:Uncharacterized protein n=1 Tax=Perkinsus olseni TaxID=32597 RepID=A0A7J6M3C3_PEROL|nr:hypothetical protein FOZ61_010284 [Perkinsus olseni]
MALRKTVLMARGSSRRSFAKTSRSSRIPSMADYLSTERGRTPAHNMTTAAEGVASLIGRAPTSSAALKREAVESRINVLVTEIDSLRTALRLATEQSASLKGELEKTVQESERVAGEPDDADDQQWFVRLASAREEAEKIQQKYLELKAEMDKLTSGKTAKKSSGGFDELPDPESEELVAWRLRSQDLEQELDDLKRDYQQMEKDWSDRLVEEQGNRALPIVMVASCVALTVGAGSVYAVNHYHHKDRLKMCERQLEFENRISTLDRAYTETLMKLSTTEKALASADAEITRLQQPPDHQHRPAWWKFW